MQTDCTLSQFVKEINIEHSVINEAHTRAHLKKTKSKICLFISIWLNLIYFPQAPVMQLTRRPEIIWNSVATKSKSRYQWMMLQILKLNDLVGGLAFQFQLVFKGFLGEDTDPQFASQVIAINE